MGSALKLGKVFGIQLRLHYTWFIIFILVTIALVFPDWTNPTYWIIGIITSLLFFASVVAHELAHSLVGRANGIPISSITLFIFGGIAHMTREAERPGAELKMAAAGPVCSLVIGGLFGLIWWFMRDTVMPIAVMVQWLAYINVSLAVFNLIPGFPLDGGRVFRSLLWRFTGRYRISTQIAAQVGRGIGYLFVVGGIAIVFLRPLGLDWFSGLWLAFIGWFLSNAASASYRQARWRDVLQGVTAGQLMTSDCAVVPSSVTISQLIQGFIITGKSLCFIVADDGRLRGILTLRDIKSVPRQDWSITQVNKAMVPVNDLKIAYPGQDALSVLEQMEESNINQMPVVSGGRVIGLIARDSLTRFLRIRSTLRI